MPFIITPPLAPGIGGSNVSVHIITAAEFFLYTNTIIATMMAIGGLPRPKFLRFKR